MARREPESHLPPYRPGGLGLSRRRSPERLDGLVDSHAHLQHQRFDLDRDDVVARAREAGIERILVPGWDVPSSEAALELAMRHPDLVQAAVGVHPHHASGMDESTWGRLEALAADARTAAIGEIGLDHYRDLSPREVQRGAFLRQLDLAGTHGLPVLVHDRDAHVEVTELLVGWSREHSQAPRGVLHAFSGDRPMAERLVAAGFLISFALPVAFRSAAGPRDAARSLADGTFVVETDAPYLGPDRERRNEPVGALRVMAELGRIRGASPADLVGHVRDAYDRLVGPRTSVRPSG